MECYCDICDKGIKIKSKCEHPKSRKHNKFEKCVRTKHTIENPDFIDIDEMFNKTITNHNTKPEL